ncbi:uncharacterized protein LOC142589915 isoform X10 [Dermacentor variabilis]|uniref:uncharacterized protein LOC142589915 isoform X10 n=1 Tax=Dermacentor variabilis TaxID=34621 RepID=UPI003F5C1631
MDTAIAAILFIVGGHWFWATSHPKPCDLFGSTSVVIGSGPPLTRSLATYLDRPRIEQRTGSAKGDQYTEPAARNVESTSTASMDAAIAAILFIVASNSDASGHCQCAVAVDRLHRRAVWCTYPSLSHHRLPAVIRGFQLGINGSSICHPLL